MLDLVIIGLNHKTAPIDIREKLAFPEKEIEKALTEAHSLPSVKETMILSTCNRVEIYAISQEVETSIQQLKDFLSRYHHLTLNLLEKYLYVYTGEQAVKHIFRVASSLDSMVLGEPQILGQIKAAYTLSAETKTSGFILHRLLHRAFSVAKRVRTETQIGDNAVSVSSVAVELAEKIFGNLDQRTVLLIGAGEMSELAARHLLSAGVQKIWVTNRSFDRALSLASEFHGEAIPFEDLYRGLKKVDIVISATDSPHYLIEKERMVKVMKERKQKPLFFIDIADPRDIAPEVGDLENIYLYNLDDLQKVANENRKGREQEAQKAEVIVEEEVAKFVRWYKSLEITPTIIALKKKCEEIRKKELEKLLSLYPHLSEKERRSLEAMTSAIVNKILHDPFVRLKQKDEEALSDIYVDALRTLFQLPETVSTEEQEEG